MPCFVPEILMSSLAGFIDSFTVSLHSTNGRQIACRSVSAVQGTVSALWKKWCKFSPKPTIHCSLPSMHWKCSYPQSIFISLINHSSGHWQTMSHLPLTIPLTPGWDCVIVYWIHPVVVVDNLEPIVYRSCCIDLELQHTSQAIFNVPHIKINYLQKRFQNVPIFKSVSYRI